MWARATLRLRSPRNSSGSYLFTEHQMLLRDTLLINECFTVLMTTGTLVSAQLIGELVVSNT